MNCPENKKINKKNPVGGGSFRGQHLKSLGNFMNCRENQYFFNPSGELGRQGRRGPSEAG